MYNAGLIFAASLRSAAFLMVSVLRFLSVFPDPLTRTGLWVCLTSSSHTGLWVCLTSSSQRPLASIFSARGDERSCWEGKSGSHRFRESSILHQRPLASIFTTRRGKKLLGRKKWFTSFSGVIDIASASFGVHFHHAATGKKLLGRKKLITSFSKDRMNEDKSNVQESTGDYSFACYIHALTPVKSPVKSPKKKYFNCTLQTKGQPVRTACFLPQRYPELKTLQETKVAVRISNYEKSTTEGIIVNQRTKFSHLDKVPFEYSKTLTASGITPISALAQVAPEQLVTVKGQVTHISGIKTLNTQFEGTLKKQVLTLRDPTDSIEVVLWESYINSLQDNTTYLLENLKLKERYGKRYLNTAKDEEFKFTEDEPFNQPLVEVEDPAKAIPSITGYIMGVQEVTSSKACMSCGKSVISCPDDDILGECQSCHLLQILSSCQLQWCLRLMVQSSDTPTVKRHLTLYHHQVMQLIKVLEIPLDMKTSNAKDITLAVLKANKAIKLSFNCYTYRVADISTE